MRKILPYLFILPTLFIVSVFIYLPALNSFYLSFFKVSVFGNRKKFVWFQNYIELFSDDRFLKSFSFTITFTIVTVVVSIFLAFFIALLLNQKVPGVRVFRTLIFAPYAVSTAVAGALWSFLLNPVVGHVNYLMTRLFGIQTNWLITAPYAAYAVITAAIWKTLPFNIIFYIAGLQSIPDELVEATKLDGANAWTRTWKLIFPLLSPITYYLVIMSIISAMFQSFAIIDVMTRGGPGDFTTNMIYKIYMDGFRFSRTSIASAESVILFLIMVVVTVIYFRLGRKSVHYQ
ncbi:carbohydrate ABC transporter membrane protein 1, CUT1 family [Fervidobacterium changbaicum]|uniref:Sugar ABC transporter permease n=2 Tax=Fervidobacterium TaxID=2422 RepID=A0AAI8CKL2_FERIS|nr:MULTISPECIES: sugar ABC transporter permease [Fervidobacterium]AMW32287.1 sugar ABC transporter permease [Fervidobacterium islandicum]QAV32367.1 sugar ABC transporter permease [Fervidobacterium changbaicum]SDH21130.1 carbohydrate ABC transporter membrane protein 1, CUT1 family [Fervidobacterium changbaicum]